MTTILSPVSPHEMPKAMRQRIETIVSKVVRQAAVHCFGRDMLELIYCAGFYHGVDAAERVGLRPPQTEGN